PASVFRVCEIVTCATGTNCPKANLFCQTTDLQTYAFSTYFRPTVAGPVSCVVAVTEVDNHSGNTNTKMITLSGTGQAPPIHVEVQPGAVAFGDVRRTTDSTQAQVVVRSTGGSALAVSSVTISSGFEIKAGPTGGYALGPNESQAYAITCHPTAVGGMTGQLVVASNDPAQPSVGVGLSCNGIDSSLDIAPSPAALATTRVGEPVDTSIALRNIGAAPMTLEDVALSGTGITMVARPPLGIVLGPSEAASITVHFDASAGGDTSATLLATYDGGQHRSTQISARALATSMALTPDGDVDFGPVCAGKTRTQDFTLIGNQPGAFSLASISDPGAPFTLAAPALPLTVQGAGATPVKFQITAAPDAAATATAAVVVHTDIPSGTDHTLHLSVQGLPAGVTATPDMVDLGSNPINTTTIGQEVHLSNCNDAPTAFSNPRIEGDDALDFAIVQQPSSPMIAAAGRATWLIVLQAHSVGVKQASFAVDYDGGTASVAIQGEGLGEHEAGTSRGSYYACSTGRPSALWPVGLAALAALLRRRRRRRDSTTTA
ncbi:MAG TPA: choice-of-anchor D domain-containing protein, partial [Kofleriaceae bacterium]|nr:choice-of-anchor D domain-containing protein [Kofleriaceae bacterium]